MGELLAEEDDQEINGDLAVAANLSKMVLKGEGGVVYLSKMVRGGGCRREMAGST